MSDPTNNVIGRGRGRARLRSNAPPSGVSNHTAPGQQPEQKPPVR